jgi:hypothetical protein
MQKFQAGQALTPEEQAYLDRVREDLRNRRGAARPPDGSRFPSGRAQIAAVAENLVPLTELTGAYRGEDGGLYGQGRNDPPPPHREAYLRESEKIRPLDGRGSPSGDGKIGLITIGFSNTNLESIEFKNAADADRQKSPRVVVVNGAIGLRCAAMWAWDGDDVLPAAERQRLDREMDVLGMPKANRRGRAGLGDRDTWPTLDLRLRDVALTPSQVQVLWMKHVEAGPRRLGEFPAHAQALEADMADILIIARKRFPNLRVAYLSSRTFAGWNPGASGSPEPFAYESAFAVRWLIQRQIAGDARLNYDPARGAVNAPLMIWGPYLWARGDTPRKLDGMRWSIDDVVTRDRIHPSASGCAKVTALLMNLLKTDRGASRWFLSPGAGPVVPVKVAGLGPRPAQSGGDTTASAAPKSPPVSASSTQAPKSPAAGEGVERPIDVARGHRLMERFQAGETLSPDDQAYLDRVRREIRKRKLGKAAGNNSQPAARDPSVNDPGMIAALVPLNELSHAYKGEDGGLYGGGRNEPPAAQLAAAGKESARIRPLDAAGRPAGDGQIVLLSLGLSNTTMEFSEFKRSADADPRKSPQVVIVDGAQGGRPAAAWALSGADVLPAEERSRLGREIETIRDRMPKAWKSEWEVAEQRLKTEGVTPQQVQVIWLKEGTPMPGRFGEFPAHARAMQADVADMLQVAKARYPNLRIAYLSSRTFGGYAHDARNPEPYAYENGFSVRWVIQSQIAGDGRLNYDPQRGPVTAPVLLWGPYLWTNGTHPRNSDGLVWERSDVLERDGMHPSASGRKKVVDLLLAFFKTDPLASQWFLKR